METTVHDRCLAGEICCGCSACAVICPVDAIHMAFDKTGMYRPVIEEGKCVNCHLCEKLCVMRLDSDVAFQPLSRDEVYVSVARDRSVLQRSSSGGIGYVFAKKGLESGKPVCGVVYDTEHECAAHIVCRDESGLRRTQGSKYLQSANELAFREILAQSEGIIFGTPCQIAAADAILRQSRKRDAFLLVDIFCHGVPNQLLWKGHLRYLQGKKKISAGAVASFREGKRYRIRIGRYKAWYNEDAFYTFFLRGWMKNLSCYDCRFRRNSCADIRIGDCLVPKYAALSFSPSCIIVNTESGKAFLDLCRSELELYPESFQVIDNIQERENVPVPANWERRLRSLQNGAFPENLIRNVMRKGRVKSFAKNKLLKFVFLRRGTDDLKALARSGLSDKRHIHKS